ncbi:MAG: dehydratase [Ruminococcaceae bacterium]|nr:dehydratase [Oscillospiraceae bacterium]
MYFEDIQVGDTFQTVGRTITEADIVAFAGLTGDYNLIHTNAEVAKNSIAGQRMAHGMLVMSISNGLITRSAYYMGITEAITALTSVEQHKFKKPVVIGDTIHVDVEIAEAVDARPESGSAKVVLRRSIVNQRGQVVQEGTYAILVKKRGA